jgi:LCP family protein required for cell wall assembly
MKKKLFLILIPLILFIAIGSYILYNRPNPNSPTNPNIFTEKIDQIVNKAPEFKSELQNQQVINVLLLGNDIGSERKAKGQRGYNTDTIILLSLNPELKKALFISFPRDIWQNGAKINSIPILKGNDEMLNAISKISGQNISKFVTIDFDGLRWLVNAFGGVPVEVETTFTDNTFPKINDTGIMTVSFSQGTEVMTGDRALTFARSRKGNNGEGSDLKRAKRQHQILKGMVKAVENKNSEFFPFEITEFYNNVIKHTNTNLSLEDAIYIFSFYRNMQDYKVESLVLDDRYIYHPKDSSPYGGAWVFIAKDAGFKNLHTDIENFITKAEAPQSN